MSDETPQETAFDRLSRLLATPMPRRQAMKISAGILGSAILANLLPSRLLGDTDTKAPTTAALPIPVLKVRVKNFTANKAKVIDIVGNLRNMFGASINFMEHANGPLVDVNVKDGTVQDVLHQIRQQDPAYQVKVIHGRLLVYPNLPILNTVISLPVDGKTSRMTAASDLSDYLRKNVKGFDHFGTMFIGSLNSPLFQDLVTLGQRGTVLEYLAEIAGNDLGATLDIPYWSNGWYAMNLSEVDIRKATTQEKPSSQTQNFGAATSFRHNEPLGTETTSEPASHASDYPHPLDASSGPCRLLSVSYSQGPQVACKDYFPKSPCGYLEKWTANSVTFCSGDNCSGQQLTEVVTGDGSVSNPNPTCQIGDGGALSANCNDLYGGCGVAPPPANQPIIKTITQTISVGGAATAILNSITSTITACGQGSVSQSQAPAGTQAQCCGTNPPTSGLGSETLCTSSQICVTDSETRLSFCCPSGTPAACNDICCPSGQKCIKDQVTGHLICCPSNASQGCNGACCSGLDLELCINGSCCPGPQITSDSKTCCPSGQTPYGTICCPTGQNNCGGKCCANTCCNNVCCDPGCTCTGGGCCGQPAPHLRMSAEEVKRGSYATDDLSACCAPGSPPCGNVCCPSGSICCGGSCCAGTCDSTGVCIPPPNENK